MSNNYVSVRVKSLNKTKVKTQEKHDMRQSKISYIDIPDFDLLFKGYVNVNHFIDRQTDNYSEIKNRKYRKDGNLGISGIITFGKDVNVDQNKKIFDHKLDTYISEVRYFDQLAKKTINKIAKKLNGQECFYIVRHMDESKIHYHFMLTYMNRDGITAAGKLKKKDLSELQDIAGEVFGKAGLQRGKHIAERLNDYNAAGAKRLNIRNKSVSELHATYRRDIKIAEEKVKEKEKQLKEYYEKLDAMVTNSEKINTLIQYAYNGDELLIIDKEIDSKDEQIVKRKINRYIKAKNNINNFSKKYRNLEKQEQLLLKKLKAFEEHSITLNEVYKTVKTKLQKQESESEPKQNLRSLIGNKNNMGM